MKKFLTSLLVANFLGSSVVAGNAFAQVVETGRNCYYSDYCCDYGGSNDDKEENHENDKQKTDSETTVADRAASVLWKVAKGSAKVFVCISGTYVLFDLSKKAWDGKSEESFAYNMGIDFRDNCYAPAKSYLAKKFGINGKEEIAANDKWRQSKLFMLNVPTTEEGSKKELSLLCDCVKETGNNAWNGIKDFFSVDDVSETKLPEGEIF